MQFLQNYEGNYGASKKKKKKKKKKKLKKHTHQWINFCQLQNSLFWSVFLGF